MKRIIYLFIILFVFSCSSKKEGTIVMDKNGNYYILKSSEYFNNETYKIEPIDTTKFKVKGFDN